MFECSSWLSGQTHCTAPTLACGPSTWMDAVVQPAINKQILLYHHHTFFKWQLGELSGTSTQYPLMLCF